VKVVLVGDPKQLPEIDAGGLFRALTTRLPAIELTDNRRQAHTWEQAALDELRHGDPDTALAAYRSSTAASTPPTPPSSSGPARRRLVDHRHRDLPGSIMIALRRTTSPTSTTAPAPRCSPPDAHRTRPRIRRDELQAGDRIVCLRNNRGSAWSTAPAPPSPASTRPTRSLSRAVDDRGVQLTLPADYLDAGHVTHGYAITGHKAQGLTCDHTYTLGTETLYREWGYVAMSRGRLSNQLYHGPAVDDSDALHHHVHLDDDEVASLTSRLHRTRAEVPVSPELDRDRVRVAADRRADRRDRLRPSVELLRYRDPLEQEHSSLSDTHRATAATVGAGGERLPAPQTAEARRGARGAARAHHDTPRCGGGSTRLGPGSDGWVSRQP
jgi:hypothetical protein